MLDMPITVADQILEQADEAVARAKASLPQVEPPAPLARAAPDAAPAGALTPKMIGKFEAAADRHGVPVDVLLGMAERDSGFNPFTKSSGHGPRVRGIINIGDDEAGKPDVNAYDVDQALDIAAAKIKRSLDGGLSIDDAIRAHGGGGAAGEAYLADIASRGKRLASAIYPAPEAPVDHDAHNIGKPGNRNVAVDVALQAAGGLNKGIGSTIRGAGAAVALLGDYTTTPILNRLFGREGSTPNALDPVADAFSEHGKRGQAAVSEQTRRAIEDSSPKGDILKPSTWTLGKAPSLVGYTALVADVFGSMAPVIAASIASGGSATAGALAGGLQGGGDAVEKARETIDAMAKKQAADNGKPGATVLEQESAFYREQIAAGKTPAQAVALTKQAAERAAFIFTTPVSALGGAATSKLMHPATKVAAGAALPGRVVARTAASGLEEGLQEVGESVAANVGVNAAAGTSINPTEDTFGDFILGMMGGAGTGAAGGALSKREVAPAAQEKPAPTTPGGAAAQVGQGAADAAVAPSSPEPAPAPQPAPEPAKPAGPLSAALAAGAPHLVEASMPAGRQVTITETGFRSPDGRDLGDVTTNGTVIRQDKDGMTVQAPDGELLHYGADEIANGTVKFSPASQDAPNAAPPPVAVQAAPSPVAAETAPAPAPETPASAPQRSQDRDDATAPPVAAPQADMPASAPQTAASAEPTKTNRGPRLLSADEILSDPRAALASGDVSAMRLSGAPSAKQLDRLVASARKIEDEDVARAFGPDADTARRLMRSRADADQAALERLVAAKGPEARAAVFGTGASAVDAESLKRLRDTVANIEGAVDAAAQGDLTDLRQELAWIAPKLPDAKASPEAHGEGERIALLGLARAFELGAQRGLDMPAVLKSVTAQTLERAGGDAADAGVLLQRLADHAKAAQGDVPAPTPSPRPALPSPASEGPAAALPARAGEDRAASAPVASQHASPAADARASAPDATHAPASARQVEAPATPAAAKPARQSVKQARAEHDAAIADYFAPGNIVRSYGGHDRVVAFERDARGEPVVTVEAVRRVAGEWETTGEPRRHSTMPDRRGLAQGPVERAAAARASVAASAPASGMTKADLERHLTESADGALLARLIDGGNVMLHETPDTLPGEASGARGAVQGVTTADGRVHLVASNLTPQTARAALLHEAFHAGAEPLIGGKAWSALLARVSTAAESAVARERGGARQGSDAFWRAALARAREANTPERHLAEEIAAYAVEHAERAPAGLHEIASRVVGAVKAWALRRFGRQFGDVNPAQLRSLAVAALRSWRDAPARRSDGARFSLADGSRSDRASSRPGQRRADQAATWLRNRLTWLRVGPKGAMEQIGKASIYAPIPGRAFLTEHLRDIPAARAYLDAVDEAGARRNEWHEKTKAVLDDWYAFHRADAKANDALMDLMHRSTLEQVDPSKPFESFWTKENQAALDAAPREGKTREALAARKAEEDARRAAHEALRETFDALPADARKLYGRVRDAYADMADAIEANVLGAIQTATDRLIEQAVQTHADDMRRIADEGLTGKERDDAVKAADDKLLLARTRTRRNRVARMKRLRAEFEANRLKGPYFPLARFGHYSVTVRDGDGAVTNFSRFETPDAQQAFADEMRAIPGARVEVGLAEAGARPDERINQKFVADLDAVLESARAPEVVRDAIWQKYLESLSDASLRKNRIHRKGRAGFDVDALRAFSHHMFHGAHQVVRLEYGQQMQGALDDMRRQARAAQDPVRAAARVNEMAHRHDFIMNPTSSDAAQAITSGVFLWTMAGNLSSALVNATQVVQTGVGALAADRHLKASVGSAATELTKAMRDFTHGVFKPERGARASANVTPNEKLALAEGYRIGVIDRSDMFDVVGAAGSGVKYSPGRARVMGWLSAPFSQVERFNREVTYLAAYRLARKAGVAHADAIGKARELTWLAHFDNQAAMKPRLLQNDVGRVLFALKSYVINMLYRFARDFQQATKGASPDLKREARRRFLINLAAVTATAGVMGAPGFHVLMQIAALLMGEDDDDLTERLRKGSVERLGPVAAGIAMDGAFGYLTGTALTGRIGMADLWFRSPNRDLSADKRFSYELENALGPSVSLLHQAAIGLGDVLHGDVWRGVEKMAPSAVRNAMKAARYGKEGVLDRAGDEIVEDVGPTDLLKQAIGFTPARIADRHARNAYQTGLQQRIAERRREALRDAVRAESGDAAAMDRAMRKVDAFNEANPGMPIKPKTIRQSARATQRRSDRKEYGVLLDRRIAERVREATAPSIYDK